MNEITVYQCEVCGEIYETADEATKCEGSHIKIEQDMLTFKFAPKQVMPSKIIVNTDEGEIVYKL